MPPHLMKRKRDENDDDQDGSATPPAKIRAGSPQPRVLGPAMAPRPPQNTDEIALDDSDDDDIGPALPADMAAPTAAPKRVVGPSMPPVVNTEEVALDGSDDDDMGPSSPASKLEAKISELSPQPKRVLGPAMPPVPLDQMPPRAADSDSDSDDDFGPSLPPAPGSAAAYEAERQAQEEADTMRRQQQAQASREPAKAQRAEWMLAPPSSTDWTGKVDPTKLKNRKFASGKGATAPSAGSVGISAIWTETPEQKRQRLEDEVLGRKEKATLATGPTLPDHMRRGEEQEAIARRIREHSKAVRGPSLVERHMDKKEGVEREKEDDPSKRAFDREKDMSLGGLGLKQKSDMIKKAGDFGARFERGKFL